MNALKQFLEQQYRLHNRQGFIPLDPVSVPHRFSRKEDIEIAGFLVALFSWGNRVSILRSANRLMDLLRHAPYDFVLHHTDKELRACLGFVHRTFNGEDLISILGFLQELYGSGSGLEQAFAMHMGPQDKTVEKGLVGFRKLYTESASFIPRSGKHIASPAYGSACKRLNMFLRWMVRRDEGGVDFGIWNSIQPAQLVCPLDVHVIRQAMALGLLKSDKGNWKAALELTAALRRFDPADPVKYDYALFGMGVSTSH